MNPVNLCPICKQRIFDTKNSSGIYTVECSNCGKYRISYELAEDIDIEYKRNDIKIPRSIISGCIRELNENNLDIPILTYKGLNDFVNLRKYPTSAKDKFEKLLNYLNNKTKYFGQKIEVKLDEYAICYGENREELRAIMNSLIEAEQIKSGEIDNVSFVSLTFKGLNNSEKVETNQCFVAMWFTEEMDTIFNTSILPAVKDAGYEAIIIKNVEHNNNINDEIIKEIKRSKFLIADFTGNRGGVYYEAGYAHGKGLPVIFTCKKDWFNEKVDIEKTINIEGIEKNIKYSETRNIHFDIDHYSFIIWNDAQDLRDQLYNRIMATIK